jgi:hypothetical protein
MLEDAALKNVPKLVEEAINSATTQSELRELMIAAMERSGMTVPRTRDDEFNIRLTPQAAASSAPVMPAVRLTQEPTVYRVIYPSGNDRYEISGTSEQELDQKEARIRSMFGGQR